jgi:polysaccharide biosynthesis protein PslH
MRILFLTQILPYPPDSGPKVKTWHVLNYLAQKGHHITLVSFVRSDEQKFVENLNQICEKVYAIPMKRSRIMDGVYWLRSQFTGRPFLIERDDLPEMRALVQDLVSTTQFDYIHADQFTMTQFAFPLKQGINPYPKRIFDAHNAVWTIVKRMGEHAPWFLKPFAALEAKRIKLYEGMIVRTFEHTLVVTSIDHMDLCEALDAYERTTSHEASLFEPDIISIPIAVDTNKAREIDRQQGSKNIVTLGTLHYPPNADGIRWFLKEVFPLVKQKIQDATLTIIGKNPPDDFIQIAQQNLQDVFVTGYVPDLIPYFEKSALVVVPVRAGSGMRVRILESFAYAMPVITTTIGLEGINAHHGEEVLVADTPEEFAGCVIEVLQNEQLQVKLASNGRRLAESFYDWRVALQKLDRLYNNY